MCRKNIFSFENIIETRLWFSDFLIGSQGRMVDALVLKDDEGRGPAAIRFGEVPNNL